LLHRASLSRRRREADRQAHLNGEIAKALMANAGRLLAQPPELGMAEVLAAKVPGA
jgi:hypothetical protein